MKFLIVEDDSRMRRIIGSIVAEPSDTVYECSDGAQAHACYLEHQPDWVLMDLMMPEVDGLAATREIKASYPAARIIIVTNHDSAAMREEAAAAGAMAYVAKENLLELRELLGLGLAPSTGTVDAPGYNPRSAEEAAPISSETNR